jgi:hypothetical protein
MFSYHKIENSYPIATTKKGKTVYFLPDINPDIEEIQKQLIEKGNIKDLETMKSIMKSEILSTELKLERDDEFFPIPEVHNKKRFAISIIGSSGSGKSTFTGKFIEKYHELKKDYEKFLLSNKNEGDEPAFEKLDYLQYIPINSLTEPISIKEFEKTLFCFDDIHEGVILNTDSDFIKDLRNESFTKAQKIINARQKNLDDIVNRSSINILSLGRSREISIIIVKHQFRDSKSNIYKSENTHLVVFPSSNKTKIQEYFKNIEGLDKEQIKRLFNLKESKGNYQFLYISRQGLKYAISNRNIISLDI